MNELGCACRGAKIGIRELVLTEQELRWRHFLSLKLRSGLVGGCNSVKVPERPTNPMTRDAVFMRREIEVDMMANTYSNVACVKE